MTVIAYRNGVLAADKQSTRGSTFANKATKIARRSDGALIGCAGATPIALRYRQWFLSGEAQDSRPALREGDDSAGAIVVRPDGTVEEHIGPAVEVLEGEFFAVGCGADFALAAMEMGANAERAVEVASKFDVHCGGGVDVLYLAPADIVPVRSVALVKEE